MEGRLLAGKATGILTNYFSCVFFTPCKLPRFIHIRIYETMRCLVCFFLSCLLSSGERVSTEDENLMVKSVTFYELNSKNRITATGIARERNRKRSAH